MRSTIKLFGSTLDQVCSYFGDQLGDKAINPSAKIMASSILVASASERVTGNAVRVAGVFALTAATAMGVAVAPVPAHAQSVIVVDSAPDSSLQQKVSNITTNDVARVVGGIFGALAGNSLTQGSGTLSKTVGILGGGYLGQAAGNYITEDPAKRSAQAQPVKANVQQASVMQEGQGARPGTESNPTYITREVYENAITRVSSSQPIPATPNSRQMDPNTHSGLYALMLDTASSRAIAKLALNEMQSAELARAVTPGDVGKAANFSQAGRAYKLAFSAYDASFRQTSQAIAIAERNNFDVTSHRLMMGVMPSSIQRDAGATVNWPGMDQRISELSASQHVDGVVSLGDLSTMGSRQEAPSRMRR